MHAHLIKYIDAPLSAFEVEALGHCVQDRLQELEQLESSLPFEQWVRAIFCRALRTRQWLDPTFGSPAPGRNQLAGGRR